MSFGPPLKSKHTEKHWIEDDDWKFYFKDKNYCKELIHDYWMYYWLEGFKYYGAEWMFEDNN
jgi:hypothetical protein